MLSSLDRYVTLARVRFFGIIFFTLTCVTMLAIFATAHNNMDILGRPVGTDFAGIWSAGVITRTQGPEYAYDFARHNTLQRDIFGKETLPLGYHYPPVFTLLVEPLSVLAYVPAFIVYQLAGFAFYLWAMRGILRALPVSLWLWPVIGFPAVWVNLTHAHNGFLTAALFGGGLYMLRTRPAAAGILLGALCYKPQFGLLIPLALAAGGHWRSFFTAALTVTALVALSYMRYGEPAWAAFYHYSHFTQTEVIERGMASWYKMQTVFAAARMWGAPVPVAYGIYAAAAAGVMLTVWRVWRSPAAFAPKAACLMTGALLVSPYAFDYDLMLLAPAIGFLAVQAWRSGPVRHEPALLGIAWLMPFFTRLIAQHTGLPVGVLVLAALFLFAARQGRIKQDLSTSRPLA